MSKILVVYRSKYGSTKKYAEWIAGAAGADLCEASDVNEALLKRYDTIVFGGSLHAVGIRGMKAITKHYKAIEDKKIVVFAVGCSPGRDRDLQKVREANFTEDMRERIHFFYARGAFDFKRLRIVDKTMMGLLRMKLQRIEEPGQDIKDLLTSYDHPVDFTRRENIEPVIRCIEAP
jgi:menaquinone-dependent protoporphyrinogen IX oxidase